MHYFIVGGFIRSLDLSLPDISLSIFMMFPFVDFVSVV